MSGKKKYKLADRPAEKLKKALFKELSLQLRRLELAVTTIRRAHR